MLIKGIRIFLGKFMGVTDVNHEKVNYGEVDSVEFAIYLNQKATELGLSVNVTKIQKWLYICYGIYLAAKGEQLLTERPKAWEFGPAFPRVHKKQKKNNGSLNGLPMSISADSLGKYDEVIIPVLDHFGTWTASGLVAWTHEEGKAWHKKYHNDEKYASLDNHDIILDFERFVTKRIVTHD